MPTTRLRLRLLRLATPPPILLNLSLPALVALFDIPFARLGLAIACDSCVSPAIVAISQGERSANATDTNQVVGVVRIYEVEPGIWYGGRLGTHPDYRRGWQIGKGLIYKAVTTANTWGCKQFLATVQLQNVRFFQRLHWETMEEIIICDRPHHLMSVR